MVFQADLRASIACPAPGQFWLAASSLLAVAVLPVDGGFLGFNGKSDEYSRIEDNGSSVRRFRG
jgi:hypothetical protein